MVERIVPKTPALAERERKAIEDLQALFPDGNVAGLDGKDKSLGKRLSALYRSLGYESRADMIAALGFRQDPDNRGGRPVTVDPEALFAELQRRYEGKPKPTALGILMHDNPDLSGTMKTVQNKCNELYGHTITVELIERGLLDRKMPARVNRLDDDAILDALSALENKYASAPTRPATVAELKTIEPEYAEALESLTSRKCDELLGMSLARYLKAKGIIGTGATVADDAVAEVLDTLQEHYRGKPNDDKPKTIAALLKAHPEHADALKAGQKAQLVTKDILMERGILGLSQAALKARAKALKERCVRNARVSELARMYAGSGGAELVLPGERVDYLRPGVVGVDLKYRYELREVAVTALDANLVVGDVLKPFHNVSSGWYNRSQLELFKGEARVTHIERPAEDDFLTSKTYVDPTPLKEFEGAEVIGLETVAGRQLARIRYRFLSIISRETLLYALYRMGALDDAELYANDDSWRARLEQLPEEPFRGDTPHAGVATASSGFDAQAASDEQVVGLEELLPLPEEQGNLSLAESASFDGGVIAGAGAVAEELGAEQPEPSEIPLAVHDEDMDGNGPELALDDEAGLSEGSPVSDGWTFERHQLAVGRRFSVEVPDQWVLTPDENGRPLARYEKGVDEESEYPQIICSAMAGDLDEETQATLRENVIPEARIQLSRKAIYGNDMANTLSRVVNDWVVEGKNCQVLVFEILMPSIFPGFTSDSYEYHVKPIAYDHEDFLRLTDSWGHLGEGRLKELAFAIAPTVELDGPVELRRPAELEQYREEPADADAFCELVGVISNMLNLSGSERTNANLWREIRRSNNDKNCLMVAGTMPRIQAEAYNASLDDEVAYYGRLVTALERQHELHVDGFGKMWKLVGEFGDVRVVDHVTMEDDEEAAKAVNSLGIISIPASYQALHERWEALGSSVSGGMEKPACQTDDEAARMEEEEAARKAKEQAEHKAEEAKLKAEEEAGKQAEAARYVESEEERNTRIERKIIELVESGCQDDDEICGRIESDPENKRFSKPASRSDVRRAIRELQREERIEYYFIIGHSLHRPHWISDRYRWHLENPGIVPNDISAMTGIERAKLAHQLILEQFERRTYHCCDRGSREDELAELTIRLGGGVSEEKMIVEAGDLAYKWITSGDHYDPKLLPANAENKAKFITSALGRAVRSLTGAAAPILVKRKNLYYAWCQHDVKGEPITDPYAGMELLERQASVVRKQRDNYRGIQRSLSTAERREAELREEIRAYGFFGGGAEKKAKKAERAEMQKAISDLKKKLQGAPKGLGQQLQAMESELDGRRRECERMKDLFRWY